MRTQVDRLVKAFHELDLYEFDAVFKLDSKENPSSFNPHKLKAKAAWRAIRATHRLGGFKGAVATRKAQGEDLKKKTLPKVQARRAPQTSTHCRSRARSEKRCTHCAPSAPSASSLHPVHTLGHTRLYLFAVAGGLVYSRPQSTISRAARNIQGASHVQTGIHVHARSSLHTVHAL